MEKDSFTRFVKSEQYLQFKSALSQGVRVSRGEGRSISASASTLDPGTDVGADVSEYEILNSTKYTKKHIGLLRELTLLRQSQEYFNGLEDFDPFDEGPTHGSVLFWRPIHPLFLDRDARRLQAELPKYHARVTELERAISTSKQSRKVRKALRVGLEDLTRYGEHLFRLEQDVTLLQEAREIGAFALVSKALATLIWLFYASTLVMERRLAESHQSPCTAI